eukprot:2469672-Pleurochrysis_carterae.AAC.1
MRDGKGHAGRQEGGWVGGEACTGERESNARRVTDNDTCGKISRTQGGGGGGAGVEYGAGSDRMSSRGGARL